MRAPLTLCCSLLYHARVSALRATPIAATLRGRTPTGLKAMLDGTSWRLTVDVGREAGTWMPKEWAASGASLTLPIAECLSAKCQSAQFPTLSSLRTGRDRARCDRV
eukprot:scaffold64625_cov72-Phaeocystis_antarctica.AAC.2